MKLQNLIHILINRRAGPVAGRILKRDVNIAVRSQRMEAPPAQGCPNIQTSTDKITRNVILREESNRPIEDPRSENAMLFHN